MSVSRLDSNPAEPDFSATKRAGAEPDSSANKSSRSRAAKSEKGIEPEPSRAGKGEKALEPSRADSDPAASRIRLAHTLKEQQRLRLGDAMPSV